MLDNINNTPITYFFRNQRSGFSIYKAISPIVKDCDKIYIVPKYRGDILSVLTNMLFARRHFNRNGINHVTGDVHYLVLAMLGCKTVLTIHDMVAVKTASNPIKKALLKWLWFKLPLRFADRITCISESTKKQLLENFKIKSEALTVIYDPLDPMFEYHPKEFDKINPRILHVGTGWNKNLLRVIKALKGIKCKLVIVGKIDEEQRAAIKASSIDFENYVGLSDERIYEEYCKCDIVSFPSIYEGFGMPIIEGMGTGRVVVTSDVEPMNEVAGRAACLVVPTDVESIRNGFIRVIFDDEYRDSLIKKGLENVNRFKKERIIEEYNKVYNSLL